MRKKNILLMLLLISALVNAQERTITGTITSDDNPVVGATITVKNTKVSAKSDSDGKYSITVKERKQKLIFIAPDLKDKEIKIGENNVVNVVMKLKAEKKISELTLEELINFKVFSSTKLAQMQSLAPNVISVITGDVIKDFGWNSMNDILYKQAGFFPSQDYERETAGSRGIQEGWNMNHLLLLIDGIPMNTNLSGTAITNEFTPLTFTKSFEIIKGPGSALYGSNATNGILTLNTISASDFDKNKLFASIKYGEQNTMFYDVLTTFKTKNLDITASLSYNSTDGDKYLEYDGSLEMDLPTNTLKQFEPRFDRYGGYFFLKLEGKEKIDGLSLQLHSQLINTGTGFGWLWHTSDNDDKVRDSYSNVILKYNKDITPNINTEIAFKYSHHIMNWDIFLYRAGAHAGYYPDAVHEYTKTSFDNIFTRLQFIFKMFKKSVLVIATEPNLFMYFGDKEHYSNTDLMNEAGGYPPFGENRPMGPLLEFIENKTVKNIGSFAQYSTGELLGKYIQATIGLRYDIQFFDYIDVTLPDRPAKSKDFDDFSPRLSIVIAPTDRLSFKLLGVTAFRSPAPTELFAYNSWCFASNINELVSERIKSLEFAVDYNINKYMNIRFNTFYTISEGQIGYSIANINLSTDMYDLTNFGAEGEIIFIRNKFSAFANLAYVKRIDEKIFDGELTYVSLHKDKLSWAPAYTANIGIRQRLGRFNFSLQGHYQDLSSRRDKDFYSTSELNGMGFTDQPRSLNAKAWFSVGAQITYKYKFVEFGINGTNILNSDNYIIKSLKYPFDYKMEGRRISAVLNFEF